MAHVRYPRSLRTHFQFWDDPLVLSNKRDLRGLFSRGHACLQKSSRSVIIRLYQQLAPIKESDSLQNVDMGRFMPEIRLGHRRGGQHVVSRVAPAGPSAGGCHSSPASECLGTKGQEGLAWARRGPVWPSKAPRRADTACVHPRAPGRAGFISVPEPFPFVITFTLC